MLRLLDKLATYRVEDEQLRRVLRLFVICMVGGFVGAAVTLFFPYSFAVKMAIALPITILISLIVHIIR